VTGPTSTGNEAPTDGLSAPESLQDPEVGTERRLGGLNGPQTGAQSLDAPDSGPTVAEAKADDVRWPLEKAGE
jgi:hypothetical protein